ncbi:hypothetical protein MMYC01_201381 [Madurella mycetomatis]|uniref:Myb-like DNA-binding domain-containing protein n=1 Tax=Madurella mycetomatis TaxID=100816 RepID=A0A175WBT7_9PEZI|nr:hypothetical protein MMYC01_201381 [Madurella mycetomatis]
MSNNDNAMARFLFAILQQKSLKDIDWNKVARNPILSQEITNGHAARMRYSRFRAAMLGLEPQRRNRTNPTKSRVAKRKRDDGNKLKKEENGGHSDTIKTEDATTATIESERRNITQQSPAPSQPSMMPTTLMKNESELTHRSYTRSNQYHRPSVPSASSPKTKQEMIPTAAAIITPTTPMPEPYPFGIAAATTPTSTSTAASAPAASADIHPNHRAQMRLPTPSSDSDILQGSAHNHNHTHTHAHNFIPPSPIQAGADLLHHHHSPAASAGPPYDFTGYDAATSPWHSQHHHTHQYHGHHSPASVYSAGFVDTSVAAAGAAAGGGGGGGYTLDTGYGPFCGEHHPHHIPDGDGLGLVHPVSIFRERELEMGIGMGMEGAAVAGDSQGQGVNLKHEWETGEY